MTAPTDLIERLARKAAERGVCLSADAEARWWVEMLADEIERRYPRPLWSGSINGEPVVHDRERLIAWLRSHLPTDEEAK